MPTTAVWVCADCGGGVVLAHTAWNVLFCRTHTLLRTPDWSTWCRWCCTEVVARPPGHPGRKREPEVPVPETTATFAGRSRVEELAEYERHPFLHTAVRILSRQFSPFTYPAGAATISSPRLAFSRRA